MIKQMTIPMDNDLYEAMKITSYFRGENTGVTIFRALAKPDWDIIYMDYVMTNDIFTALRRLGEIGGRNG